MSQAPQAASSRIVQAYYAATILFLAGSIAWYAWHRGMAQLFGPPR